MDNLINLIGQTIVDARFIEVDGADDNPYILIRFADGSKYVFISSYGGYTGLSIAEYPAFIDVVEYSEFVREFEEDNGKYYKLKL